MIWRIAKSGISDEIWRAQFLATKMKLTPLMNKKNYQEKESIFSSFLIQNYRQSKCITQLRLLWWRQVPPTKNQKGNNERIRLLVPPTKFVWGDVRAWTVKKDVSSLKNLLKLSGNTKYHRLRTISVMKQSKIDELEGLLGREILVSALSINIACWFWIFLLVYF